MEGRRWRRERETILPLRTRRLSNTISCCYCDFKVSAFNLPLFRFGRTHSRLLRIWFSIGVGFCLTTLIGTTLLCAWESARAFHIFGNTTEGSSFLSALLFGYSPSVSGLRISLPNFVYILISSLVSITAHEFGHAVAAASEGLQVEYIAIFIAALFPGALVAFNSEQLQALPSSTALRIYCAGIWHNAVCCAVCCLTLILLPLILYPLYIHGESSMVLDVSPKSPLSAHLAPGDVLVSIDGMPIHDPQEWKEIIAHKDMEAHGYLNASDNYKHFIEINGRKGYCVSLHLVEESKQVHMTDNQSTCPDNFSPFVRLSCFVSSVSDDISNTDYNKDGRRESWHCLNINDVIRPKNCGGRRKTVITNGNDCMCSEDESCLSPVNMPGMTWVAITYSSPYSENCLQLPIDSSPDANRERDTDNNQQTKCGGTFVFVGDVISLAHSVLLTGYQPRWRFFFGASYPSVLEKILTCTFHVSLALALLNSLPVYYLDGESMLEVSLCYFSFLGPVRRKKALKACLLVGTVISILAFFRIFLFTIF